MFSGFPKTLFKQEIIIAHTASYPRHLRTKRIEDPAINSIMQAVFVARDKFKAQLDTLKANTQVTVDKRPSTPSQTLLSPIAQLTASEREALQKAVSRDYLELNGMREGAHGEILTDRGRVLFKAGFAPAIRKLLGDMRVPG